MDNIIDLVDKGKIKRLFRARNKYSYEGAITHITQHASGIEPLFLEEADYIYMLHLIKKLSKEFKFDVYSFVLMLNHLHLLIRLNQDNLSLAMQILFKDYAVYFNSKYDRKGHVFSGAYRAALCLDELYLLAASLYIHLNPVRAGLVTDPVAYRWSSCALFVNDLEKKTFLDYKFILNILDEDTIKASLKYKDLLKSASTKRVREVLEHPRALDTMVQILKKDLINYYKGEDHRRPIKEFNLLDDEDLERSIEELRLKERLKGPTERKAREYLIHQLQARGFNVKEIASKLNLNRHTIYNYLAKTTHSNNDEVCSFLGRLGKYD
jgi:putative transposase